MFLTYMKGNHVTHTSHTIATDSALYKSRSMTILKYNVPTVS